MVIRNTLWLLLRTLKVNKTKGNRMGINKIVFTSRHAVNEIRNKRSDNSGIIISVRFVLCFLFLLMLDKPSHKQKDREVFCVTEDVNI